MLILLTLGGSRWTLKLKRCLLLCRALTFQYAVSIGSYIKGRRTYYPAQNPGHENVRKCAPARTFAHLQLDLHRLRTHSGILDIPKERDGVGGLPVSGSGV
jgi:hypothetical protein